jgi:prophage regulatory protein
MNITRTISSEPAAYYTIKDVKARTSLSIPLIYRLHKDSTFPAPIGLSERRIAWDAAEVQAWMQACVDARPERAPHAPTPAITAADRFIALKEVCSRLGLSRQSVDRLEAHGLFPLRIRIGQRRMAWLKSEIDAWTAERAPPREEKASIPATPDRAKAPEPAVLPTNPFMSL